jgi:hypothetical protein
MTSGILAQLLKRVELLEQDVFRAESACAEGRHVVYSIVKRGKGDSALDGSPLFDIWLACSFCDTLFRPIGHAQFAQEVEVDQEKLAEEREKLS